MSGSSSKLIRQQYNEVFIRELDRLNPKQKEAVEQIEGPVLVIAGPGTGKTHILTARIGRILQATDTQAANILCLTFTDAGVHAMRERLLEFIGPEAHRVHIFTFHAFCNKVIQDNLELFGRHDLEPLNDLERVELIRQLIDQLRPDHLLRRKSNDPYFYERHLYDLFKTMKSEAWSPAFMKQQIRAYVESLTTREEYIYKRKTKEYKKGDLKQWKYDEEVIRMKRLEAAVALYPRYVKAMEQARRYDFDDMILWVLRAFEEHESLLRNYQEQYLYFLVDEYQDTNGAQNRVLQKLFAYWEQPNIFIVGDDDQSIYEFQGARLKNLVDFYQYYQSQLRLVLLQDNYRSSQHILDSSKALIDENHSRIIRSLKGLEKVLKAQNRQWADSLLKPQVLEYANRAQEEADIVAQIEALQSQGVQLDEIAIIYARHKQARNIISLLEKKKIPYTTKREVNILDLPRIRNLRQLLAYLQAEFRRPYSGEPLLFQLLYFDFWKIPTQDLARLSLYMAQQAYEQKPRWRDLLSDPERLQQIGLQAAEQLAELMQLLNSLIVDCVNLGLPVLLERVINRTGLLHQIMAAPDRSWQLQVVKTFFDFVRRETDKQPRLSLQKLLDMLDNMDANRLPIRLNRQIHAGEGVHLITAHSSKGLEFRYVFMIDGVKDFWEPARSNRARKFTFPDTITLSGEEDAMEARRRLFYVAMTRAKEHLLISYALKDHRGKNLQRVQYIDEILQKTALKITPRELTAASMEEAQLLLMLEPEQPTIPTPGKEEIEEILKNFVLSISSLNTFLRCPLSFFYEYILRVPVTNSEAAAYGTAMHFALRRIFEKMRSSKQKELPDVEQFRVYFREELRRQGAYFTDKGFARRMELGERYLAGYYEQHKDKWSAQVLVEYNIRQIEVQGAPVAGTVDRIDLLKEQRAHIVDYKTGSLDRGKLRAPSKANPHGGNYWRQLLFYKTLYESFQQDRLASSLELSYLEPDHKGQFQSEILEFSQEQVQWMKGLIADSYQKIRAHQFYTGCGEVNCNWCNFVKNRETIDSFADVEKEELDDSH